MPDSFLDSLGGPERERVIKRLRSPEAYERLRENVKGPEELERALDRAEKMAELHFALESDRGARERLHATVERALREGGLEAVLEDAAELTDETRAALADGRFALAVSPDPVTAEDALAILPEGSVSERLPVKMSVTDACVSRLSGNA